MGNNKSADKFTFLKDLLSKNDFEYKELSEKKILLKLDINDLQKYINCHISESIKDSGYEFNFSANTTRIENKDMVWDFFIENT